MKKLKFINCQVDVSKKVFRPREETVFWVGKTLKELRIKNYKLRILDIFAGTGCIGIAVLKNVKNSQVDFVDIWPDAVKQIKINLKLNEIPESRYRIYHSNLFEKLKWKKYDYIFANPPYVALKRIKEVQKEVLEKDPALALFAGKDGLAIIEIFLAKVKKHLKPNGKIFMEFDPLQKDKIKETLEKEGFRFIFKKDQFRKYRWLEAKIVY